MASVTIIGAGNMARGIGTRLRRPSLDDAFAEAGRGDKPVLLDFFSPT